MRLVAMAGESTLAQAYGALRGQIEIADDFDDLPDDVADAFGRRMRAGLAGRALRPYDVTLVW
jgi:hypothetical protein